MTEDHDAGASGGRLARVLDGIERVGNRLPDPERRATLRELATCDVRRPPQADGRSGETAACEVAENCAAIWGVLAKGATLEVQRVTLRVQ